MKQRNESTMNINGLTKNKIQEYELILKQANDEQLPYLYRMVETEIRTRQLYEQAKLVDDLNDGDESYNG